MAVAYLRPSGLTTARCSANQVSYQSVVRSKMLKNTIENTEETVFPDFMHFITAILKSSAVITVHISYNTVTPACYLLLSLCCNAIPSTASRTASVMSFLKISLFGTAGRLLIRGKIRSTKVDHPKFEGHMTPNEDECKKSVQLKFIYCLGVS